MDRIKKIIKYSVIILLMAWILILETLTSAVEIRADETSSTTSSTNSGQTLYDALRAIYGDSRSSSSTSSSSSSSSAMTTEQLMKRMETTPIGPTVEDTELDELYHADYKVYEERLGDVYTIYANVKNGGVTNRPVVIDVPKGVGATMKKDGSDVPFVTKQVIENEGAYVLQLFVGADEDTLATFSDQTFLRAKFRFRIQYKTGVGGIVGEGDIEELEANTVSGNYEDLPEDMRPDDFVYEDSLPEDDTLSENEIPEEPEDTTPVNAELSSRYDSATGYYRNTLRNGDSFYTSVPNGAISNEAVLVQETEGLTFTAYRNGQAYEDFKPGEYIQTTGSYDIYVGKADDAAYNEAYKLGQPAFRVRIVSEPVSDLRIITAPEASAIRNVRHNGLDLGEEVFVDDDTIYLNNDGEYELTIEDEAGSREIYFTLDTEQPLVSVSVQPNEATVTYLSNDTVRAVLYKGDEVVSDPQLVQSVTTPGKYTLYVYDAAGNSSKSEFTVRYRINAAAVIAILGVIAIIAGVVIYLIRMKKKVKVV